MSAIQEIEQAVSQLKPKELARFRKWFDEFDAKAWDQQFEQDAHTGQLDQLAQQAAADFHSGQYKEL
jgi:hypothetical protein